MTDNTNAPNGAKPAKATKPAKAAAKATKPAKATKIPKATIAHVADLRGKGLKTNDIAARLGIADFHTASDGRVLYGPDIRAAMAAPKESAKLTTRINAIRKRAAGTARLVVLLRNDKALRSTLDDYRSSVDGIADAAAIADAQLADAEARVNAARAASETAHKALDVVTRKGGK